MKNKSFRRFQSLVLETTGIVLNESKEPLLAARLAKRARALGMEDLDEYLVLLESNRNQQEFQTFQDLISTHVTHFFREKDHFTLMEEWLRRLPPAQPIKMWSAASSTGEEPYTMAMTASEALGAGATSRVRILATDLALSVLAQAWRGVYGEQSLSHVPANLKTTYFAASGERGERSYRVDGSLKSMIHFAKLNLIHFPYPMKGPFDAIFCRNVMIYFDNDTRARILKAMTQLLAPGGLLFLGHSESLSGFSTDLKVLKPSVYRKVER